MRPALPGRGLRLLAIPVLIAGAVFAALFANDLRAWPGAFARGDLLEAAGGSPSWRPGTTLPAGWSEGALGLAADRDLRLAIRQFRRTYRLTPGFEGGVAQVQARDAAEAALAAAAGRTGGARASQALDLLGLLVFGDSTATGDSNLSAKAVGDLDQAVALDGSNADAKANLELVLRLLRTSGSRPGSSASSGPSAGGHRGAGSGAPGEGY